MATNSVKPARSVPLSFPKRELSPLRRACLSLGLPVDTRPGTNLARLLRKAGLGKTAIEYLKFSEGEQVRQIVELYYSLKSATERKAITIDYLIMAAGADVHHVSGLIQEGLSRATECEATLLACTNAPAVVSKAIESAKMVGPKGFNDRNMLLRIAGVIPASPQPGFTSGDHQRRT